MSDVVSLVDLTATVRASLDAEEQAARALGCDSIEAVDYLLGTKYLILRGEHGATPSAEMNAELADYIAHQDPVAALDRITRTRTLIARLRAELEQARAQIRAVEQVRCWTNEDGKRFVFADDLLAAVQLAAPACTCGAEAVHQTGCPAPARA